MSCCILFNSNQAWCSFSFQVFRTNCMSWSLRSNHCNINILWWNDTSKMNIESMRKHQHVTWFQVWLDIFLIHVCLFFIIDQDHDDISLFCCFCRSIYFQTLFFCFFPRFRSFIQSNDDISTTFF